MTQVIALQETPRTEASVARHAGLSKSTVHRWFELFGPHLRKMFKLSTDPFFVEKVRDIVGLYLNHPEHAVVLCVEEKSQIPGPRPHPADPAENIRRNFVEGGRALERKRRKTPLAPKIFDSEAEAGVVALYQGRQGYANRSLRLLAGKVVELGILDSISHETVRRTLKNGFSCKRTYWVISSDAEFVANMEQVLEI